MTETPAFIALRKQVAMSTAQVLFQRFWYTSSMEKYGIAVRTGQSTKILSHRTTHCRKSGWVHFIWPLNWKNVRYE
jgi:hypothetical protein